MKFKQWFGVLVFISTISLISVTIIFTSQTGNHGETASTASITMWKPPIAPIEKMPPISIDETLDYLEEIRMNKTEEIIDALGSRNATDLVLPDEDSIIIQPHKRLPNDTKPFAVILVTSLAEETHRRDLIRETWYKWADEYDCLIYFFMGLPKNESVTAITEEASRHGDIILDDYEEGYYKLTIKILRMLKWYLSVYEEDPTKYFVKTDHDVFVNIPVLFKYLQRVKTTSYIGGKRYVNYSPHRNPTSKWFVPKEIYEDETFPTYVAGPCYFMSGGLVERLYRNSFEVPLLHLEDVYLMGLVAEKHLKLNISDVNNMIEQTEELNRIVPRPSKLRKSVILHPMEPPQLMIRIYEKIIHRRRSNDGPSVICCFYLNVVLFVLLAVF